MMNLYCFLFIFFVRGKNVFGLDLGFFYGCKLVVFSLIGKVVLGNVFLVFLILCDLRVFVLD